MDIKELSEEEIVKLIRNHSITDMRTIDSEGNEFIHGTSIKILDRIVSDGCYIWANRGININRVLGGRNYNTWDTKLCMKRINTGMRLSHVGWLLKSIYSMQLRMN